MVGVAKEEGQKCCCWHHAAKTARLAQGGVGVAKIGEYPARKSLTLFDVSYCAAVCVMVRRTSGEICDFIELGERLCIFLSVGAEAVPEMSRPQKIQQVARRG
jgi:hypothetical protein